VTFNVQGGSEDMPIIFGGYRIGHCEKKFLEFGRNNNAGIYLSILQQME